MSPTQMTVSLLPATVESMVSDLRISEDNFKSRQGSDLYVELILDPPPMHGPLNCPN